MNLPIIPDHWTADEALAVYEFIDALRNEIWSRYQIQIVEKLRADRSTNPADWDDSQKSEEFNDDLDF